MTTCLPHPSHIPSYMAHAAPVLPRPVEILPFKWKPSMPISPETRSVVLPPISNFNLRITSPPESTTYRDVQEVTQSSPPQMPSSPECSSPGTWYGAETAGSVVAEKTAEMVCYLWFSSNRDLIRSSRAKRTRNSPTFTKADSIAASLQFTPTPKFLTYVRKLLETTQVSQSVIVLSLHYIHRLRKQNSLTPAQEGSEFRVAVVALMLANKFVDDNTYTNKTWSEVAGIALEELNRMEREFLQGIDSRLYVDKATYESWLQLLKGLVAAKEREQQHWQTVLRRNAQVTRLAPVPRYPSMYSHSPNTQSSRPRSTSPIHSSNNAYSFTFTLPAEGDQFQPSYVANDDSSMDAELPAFRPAIKRAADFMSDNYGPSRPSKRVATLQTHNLSRGSGPRSANPAVSGVSTPTTQSFARLSISTDCQRSVISLQPPSAHHTPTILSPKIQNHSTLAQPYISSIQDFNSQPQHLYFYTLSGSPMGQSDRPDANRKAKLRYAPLQSPRVYNHHYALPPPLVVHSANTSPHNINLRTGRPTACLGPSAPQMFPESGRFPHILTPDTYVARTRIQHPYAESSVPVAHFANAGPPGVDWTVSTPHGHNQPGMRGPL